MTLFRWQRLISLASSGLFGALMLHSAAHSDVHVVQEGDDLQAVLNAAQSGDTIQLESGQYEGQFVVDVNNLKLIGPDDHSAVLKGAREGRTLWIKSEDVTVRSLTVMNSGQSLSQMDAGIFLDKTAHRALIEKNRVLDNLVGVYLWGPHNVVVRENYIVGNNKLRMSERGNGVTVWNSPGSQVLKNDILNGRDGIFSNTSRENVFSGNTFRNLRYGVHYMYTNDSEVSDNISLDNDIGYAIMFSDRIQVLRNISINSRDQGVMMNYANHSTVIANAVHKAEKCVYFYNANINKITDNYFEQCEIGVHYTGAAQGNVIFNNAFVYNQTQVKYVGTRYEDWAYEGRGNYWSDHSGFDLDGDGISDTAYRPNDIIDQVIWRAPSSRILLNSPAVAVVRWAQSQFPALLPGGLMDSSPIMRMPQTQTYEKLQELLDERK
ncbi:nitrous oxide reductase family maturation protein NosD [Oligella urethralis]|uniref:Nitrous oxide reductase family maturation protein NosD n=2 Tax=Alcaligenaceae TaxID=506 RepID=A0A2N6QGI7_9BURK|nr:nitrous oxide reductase family maturation protein NosD [Oligella urethralis]PMC18693.1 nitrous oxide reductase family maturation protein NosD [Oligella urethralis]SPY07144.1 nitrous oxide reductase family maturation protein NosD [Oligella urethralis]SUA65218.1 nitrous oxide reductase family maturation protein NosD [Oligella urethralis]SUA94561.1 nitrous oxide reductase family maturation protein NosD [Oligella urethralis]